MKFIVAYALVVLGASSALAAVVPRSGDQLTCKEGNSIRPLKWHESSGDRNHGYLSFSNVKDSQGRPIATKLESDGSPAKPVNFTFSYCSAPDGKQGWMGYGKGEHSNGRLYGHVQLESDKSKCLTVTGLKTKGIHFALDDCHTEDSSIQLYQFFVEATNGITIGFLGSKNGTTDQHYRTSLGSDKGNPLQLDYVGKDYVDSPIFINWRTPPGEDE